MIRFVFAVTSSDIDVIIVTAIAAVAAIVASVCVCVCVCVCACVAVVIVIDKGVIFIVTIVTIFVLVVAVVIILEKILLWPLNYLQLYSGLRNHVVPFLAIHISSTADSTEADHLRGHQIIDPSSADKSVPVSIQYLHQNIVESLLLLL
jgi:hypothetical protein